MTASIQARVREYFEERPDQTVYLHKMMDYLKLERRQIQAAVYTLIGKCPIEVIQGGQMWVWRSDGVNRTEKPEHETGVDTQGTHLTILLTVKNNLLCADNKGDLWLARPVQLG